MLAERFHAKIRVPPHPPSQGFSLWVNLNLIGGAIHSLPPPPPTHTHRDLEGTRLGDTVVLVYNLALNYVQVPLSTVTLLDHQQRWDKIHTIIGGQWEICRCPLRLNCQL